MFLEDLPNLKRKNEPQENCKKRSLLEELQMLQKKGKGTFCLDIPAFLTFESKHIRDIEVFTDRHCPFTCFLLIIFYLLVGIMNHPLCAKFGAFLFHINFT